MKWAQTEKSEYTQRGNTLLKVNNENSRTRCVICLELTKKDTGTTSLT